ncbi:SHOCT domain-containing protein [Nocardia otitidiscaviarum]|uniref:SHOCT domain-containing protein n=2 Tax=Nocardia otitidiscaviarum TaxID=1823 RepID=A0A516NXJ9_9NOCA|nr:SHOCT domain-containing protein [Nocardia otitidiscaviarum]
MHGYDWGWGGGWMMLMPVVWILLIGVIVWAAVTLTQRSSDRTTPHRETPSEILDRRFASGEIDAKTYAEARAQLTGRGRET